MTNSWSLLYDEIMNNDELTFNLEGAAKSNPVPTGNVEITVNTERFKYNEDAISKN